MNEEQARIFAEIQELTKRYFDAAERSEFVPGETPVRLMLPSYDWHEINSVLDKYLRILNKPEILQPLRNVVRHRAAPPRRALEAKFYVVPVGESIEPKPPV